MIDMIGRTKELENCLSTTVEDQGVSVHFNSRVNKERDVSIIKVDKYYNDLKIAGETPKSVDNIVVIDCQCNKFVMYIFELKSSKDAHNISFKDVKDKFDNTIENFIKERFKHIFLNDKFSYKNVFLYAIAKTRLMSGYSTYADYIKVKSRISKNTHDYDLSLSQKTYKIKNVFATIKFEIPPNPIMDYI